VNKDTKFNLCQLNFDTTAYCTFVTFRWLSFLVDIVYHLFKLLPFSLYRALLLFMVNYIRPFKIKMNKRFGKHKNRTIEMSPLCLAIFLFLLQHGTTNKEQQSRSWLIYHSNKNPATTGFFYFKTSLHYFIFFPSSK